MTEFWRERARWWREEIESWFGIRRGKTPPNEIGGLTTTKSSRWFMVLSRVGRRRQGISLSDFLDHGTMSM